MKVFITGSAGFIGFHLARRLIEQGHEVMGYDGMTTYYDIDLKRARLGLLHKHENFTGVEAMLEDRDVLREADCVCRARSITDHVRNCTSDPSAAHPTSP